MSGEARRRRLRRLLERVDAPVEVEAVEPAFVHASAAGEGKAVSNERLEFLGDAVLGYATAAWLYARYPEAPEGELARRKAALASDEAIALTAGRLEFGELLVLGQGERVSGGARRPSNLGDAFEAFLAALSRSAGLEATRRFLEREHLEPLAEAYGPESDAKTALQELIQGRRRATPVYRDDGEEGPPHLRIFRARVEVDGETLGRGRGASKKAAQRLAAADALTRLREEAP